MTAAAIAQPRARPTSVRRGYRFELVKLLAQWPVRLALLACWLGPGLLVAIISQQSSLPSDTVFGRWMSQTGWAASLVVLVFCCSWVLPLLTSLVAGDVFASEGRLGTWRHLLVALRAPPRVFAGKALGSPPRVPRGDFRGEGAGEPHRDHAARGRTGRLGRRRRTGGGRQPSTGRSRRPSARAGAGRRHGTSRLGQRACADAGVRGGGAAGLGGARPLSHGPGDTCAARVAPADRAAASAARRGSRRPPELRLHRLARAVHRPGPDRPARGWCRRQPRRGGGRHRAGLPALHAPRLHRLGI